MIEGEIKVGIPTLLIKLDLISQLHFLRNPYSSMVRSSFYGPSQDNPTHLFILQRRQTVHEMVQYKPAF